MSYLLFRVRLWWHRFREKMKWKIAWWLPRSIALLCFVRVYSAGVDSPSSDYDKVYRAWEAGLGK